MLYDWNFGRWDEVSISTDTKWRCEYRITSLLSNTDKQSRTENTYIRAICAADT